MMVLLPASYFWKEGRLRPFSKKVRGHKGGVRETNLDLVFGVSHQSDVRFCGASPDQYGWLPR
jgi:hypothetical protein